MKYRSSRAGTSSSETGLTFEQVLFAPGYASDGGLYLPETIPRLTENEILASKNLSYAEIIKKVLQLFVDREELPEETINKIIDSAYENFTSPEVIDIATLRGGLIIAELFHGPTMAFKDLSLVIMAKLLDFFLKKQDPEKRCTVLVGTSGDTGPAAAHSIAGLSRLKLVLLYPKNRVSEVQELQMLTVTAENVHVYSVDGTSDDLDVPIKHCFQDREFSAQNSLCSFNSLQWGRIMLQIAHYIYVYCRCAKNFGEELRIVVPTGAAGNVAAGYIAWQLGFPIKLVVAVNSNDILYRTLSDGDLSLSPEVKATLAPAMDIQAPYNVERLLYLACNGDPHRVTGIMEQFESTGKVQLPQDVLENLQQVIPDTSTAGDGEITFTMKRCFEENNYKLCPHTATAAAYVYNRHNSGLGRTVCLATASPAKFPEACAAASFPPNENSRLEHLLKFQENNTLQQPKGHFSKNEDWTPKLKQIIVNLK